MKSASPFPDNWPLKVKLPAIWKVLMIWLRTFTASPPKRSSWRPEILVTTSRTVKSPRSKSPRWLVLMLNPSVTDTISSGGELSSATLSGPRTLAPASAKPKSALESEPPRLPVHAESAVDQECGRVREGVIDRDVLYPDGIAGRWSQPGCCPVPRTGARRSR